MIEGKNVRFDARQSLLVVSLLLAFVPIAWGLSPSKDEKVQKNDNSSSVESTESNAVQNDEASKIVDKVKYSMVSIDPKTESYHRSGKGIVIDPSGVIATSYSIVKGAKTVSVDVRSEKGHKTYRVEGWIAALPGKDLVLLKIDPGKEKLRSLPLADKQPQQADRVFTFNSDYSNSPIYEGIVASVRSGKEYHDILQKLARANMYEDSLGFDLDAEWIEATSPIPSDKTGGPLMNNDGNVLGITSWTRPGSQLLSVSISSLQLSQLVTKAGKKVLPLSELSVAHATEPKKQTIDSSSNAGVRPTIAKETTYITEPLNADGYPDYIAALNQRLGQSVTPDKNATVLLLRVFGLSKYSPIINLEQYFHILGMTPLPEKGKSRVFVDVDDYAKKHAIGPSLDDLDARCKFYDQEHRVRSGPWSKLEYPFFAEWLAANEKPLSLLVEASKRPRYFDPIVPRKISKADLEEYSGIHFQPRSLHVAPIYLRCGERALLTRAMLRICDENIHEAWKDLLACHRLARLEGHVPIVVCNWDANIMEHCTLQCDRVLLENDRLTSDQLGGIRAALEQLPPVPDATDSINLFERFTCLDWALKCQREGIETLLRKLANEVHYEKNRNDTPEARAAKAILDMLDNDVPIDWNIVLRTINSCFDRIVDAHRLPRGVERKEAVRKIEDDMLAQAAVLFDPKRDTSETYSQRIALAFIFTEFLEYTTPIVSDRAAMDFQVTLVAFALAQYRMEHPLYPKKLSELTPRYIKKLPKDIFLRDAELHYRRVGDGYLLYSVGPNGKDNDGFKMIGGWSGSKDKDGNTIYKDEEGNISKEHPFNLDDIVVRMPSKRARH